MTIDENIVELTEMQQVIAEKLVDRHFCIVEVDAPSSELKDCIRGLQEYHFVTITDGCECCDGPASDKATVFAAANDVSPGELMALAEASLEDE